jgi:tRNA pseudouridine55 synthase
LGNRIAIPDSSIVLIDKKSELASIDSSINTFALLIDKPPQWSSFRVVGLIRRLLSIKKVGHAGTLDPMATGLLIVCTGRATKSISTFQDAYKEYIATLSFGSSTPSYDKETEPDHYSQFQHITRYSLEQVIQSSFTGDILQIPPMYSAIKKNGQPLYRLARKGIEIERPPRKVTITEVDILNFEMPIVELRIRCSKGTYIRSFAHDLALALGSRAHLSGLRRTAIGTWHIDDAITPEQLINLFDPDGKTGISLRGTI